jgi:predicted transcriptional regulator
MITRLTIDGYGRAKYTEGRRIVHAKCQNPYRRRTRLSGPTMSGWAWGETFLAVVCVVSTAAVAAASTRAEPVSFRHDLGAYFDGRIRAHCEQGGLVFDGPPPALAFEGARGSLRLVEVRVRELWGAPVTGTPILLDRDVERNETRAVLAPGTVTVTPGRAAQVGLVGGPSFAAELAATSLRTEPVLRTQPAGRWWNLTAAGWAEAPFTVHGWTQRIALSGGDVRSSGPMTVYVTGASVSDGRGTVDVPAYEEKTVEDHQAAARTNYVFRYAFLDFSDARLHVQADTIRPVCGRLDLDLMGNATFHRATGTGPGLGAFNGRELDLAGELRMEEDADGQEDGSARTTVTGNVLAAGLDHVAVPVRPPGAAFPAPLIAVAGLGLLAVIWKAAAALFTRLVPDRLLAVDARRRIEEAILARPGASRPELVRVSDENLSTVRYHLRVLQRHGRVRAFMLRGRWRYAPARADVHHLTTELTSSDPRTQRLLEHLRAAALPAHRLVELLRHEWGLSRSGVWRLVRRAVGEGLVVKERRGREVLLRRAH